MPVKTVLPSIRAVPLGNGTATLRLSSRDREHLATIATLMHVAPGTVFYEARPRGRRDLQHRVRDGVQLSPARRQYGPGRGLPVRRRSVRSVARRQIRELDARGDAGVGVPNALESLSSLLLRDASLQFRFLCKTAQVLRETQRRALLLTRHDPVERVAMFLALMEDAQGEKRPDDHVIALPMNRRDIASFLNMTAGSVEAALGALVQRGVITRQDNGSVTVVDRARFESAGLDD
jgi:hypothetical protein